MRIAVNEAFARLRRARRLVLVSGTETAEQQEARMTKPNDRPATPEEHAARHELASVMEQALDEIPDSYRTVLVLREVEGLSTAETAEVLATSEEVVRTRLHRGKRLLHERLAARLDGQLAGAFPFDARRCDKIVRAVMDDIVAH